MDSTSIFDLPSVGPFFWEIVTFLVLTILLYFLAYRRIWDRIRRDEIRQRRQPVERSTTQPNADDRIERLRRTLMWREREPSRYGSWVLVVLWALLIPLQIVLLYSDPKNVLGGLGMVVAGLGIISFAAGELLYAGGRRLPAALLWLTFIFLFFPLGIALFIAEFNSHGTTSGFWMTLLYAVGVLVFYGGLLGRYLWVGNDGTRQG